VKIFAIQKGAATLLSGSNDQGVPERNRMQAVQIDSRQDIGHVYLHDREASEQLQLSSRYFGWKFTGRRSKLFLKNLGRYHTASVGAAPFDKGKGQLLLTGLVVIAGIKENVCIEEATSAHAAARD
jgi:hypothetical protein